ncbi:MAM and LDL-receptor class A domain-containing protein 2-like, partial [Lingula anatina]|uniref:MAM and LDL-receptor class A domain-containing protein 2-like n=1 Tax=Lingula anatina TaxID=7574 RepID=A0A1S3I4L6_LINAN
MFIPAGFYVYIETSGRKNGDKARLTSPGLQVLGNQYKCLSFWYHMYGAHVNSLNVYFKSGTTLGKAIWTKKGTQGNKWIQAQVDISGTVSGRNLQVVFEGVRGTGYQGDISIDDVTVVDGTCAAVTPTTPPPGVTIGTVTPPSLVSCNFQTGLCGYTQDTSDQFDWTRSNGATSSQGTGPSVDHTYGTPNGYYVFIETSSPRVPNDKARLISPMIRGAGRQCLKFWYHMFGGDVGTFNVYMKSGTNLGQPVWSSSYDQEDVWKVAQVQLNQRSSYQIVFEGIRDKGYRGDIALDDIITTPGNCPPEGSCNFDNGMCTYSNVQDGSDDFDWVIKKNNRPAGNPRTDHTTSAAAGGMMYISARKPRNNGDRARVMSQLFSPTGSSPKCFKFWWYLYNTNAGTLRAIVKSNGTSTTVWEMAASRYNRWRYGAFPVQSQSSYVIILEGVVGSGSGDIALDDTSLSTQGCGISPAGARPSSFTTTPTPATTTVTVPPSTAPNSFNCSFEYGLCGWKQLQNDQFDWTRVKGSTSSTLTGPANDHTTGSGFYIFVETSNPRKTGDAAQIESPTVTPGGQWRKCLRFWYHMYGAHVDKLNVYTKSVSLSKPIWTKQGTQGNAWKLAEIQLGITAQYTVVIEALRGPGWQGDIAIDDVTLSDGSCQPGGPIKFSTPNTFGYRNVFLDLSGVTSVSFKLKACSDGHIQLQPTKSSPEQMNYEAVIGGWSNTQSVIRDSKNGHVVTTKSKELECGALKPFWISWDGGHIRVGQGLATGQGIFLDYTNPTKFVVGGLAVSTGYGADGYWEINDPTGSGTKPLSTYCTFENGTCGWTQDTTGDQFDWILLGGSTGSGGTGPTTDHTYGTGAGRYVYIETSSPRKVNDSANLISPTYPGLRGGKICLTFWYHMYGTHIGTLNVKLNTGSSSTTIWSLSGNQGNQWIINQVTIAPTYSYQIVFQGIRGTGYQGDIAVDDVSIKDGACITAGACTFEKDLCTWVNDLTGDDFDWVEGSGATGSTGTGPSTDHTLGTAAGKYRYIEASSPRKLGDVARLRSEVFTANPQHCVKFWYHMNGQHIGTLNVIRVTRSGRNSTVWTLSGDQGDQWLYGQAPVGTSSESYRIVFEAIRGTGYQGDIAIDDVDFAQTACAATSGSTQSTVLTTKTTTTTPTPTPSVTPTPTTAPGSFNCSFDVDSCGWTQDKTDKFDWTRQSSGTGSFGTGPSTDHTTSAPIKVNTPDAYTYQNIFLDFRGVTSVTFKVKACNDVHVSLSPTTNSQDRKKYEVVIGGWGNGQSVIREKAQGQNLVTLVRPKMVDCNILKPFWISWDGGHIRVGQGLTVNQSMFLDYKDPTPYAVRSMGVATGFGAKGEWEIYDPRVGFYYYIETSSPRVTGDMARLVSPMVQANGTSCLTFWYHMYGAHVDKLNVYVMNRPTLGNPVWTRAGTQGDKWVQAQVNIRARGRYKVVFEGLRGAGYQGDIAVDDVTLLSGTCAAVVTPTVTVKCDFEKDVCNYTQDNTDQFDWTRKSGSTSSSITGPTNDHTYGTPAGSYMYVESSSPRVQGDIARLITTSMAVGSSDSCIQFWYHMYGADTGSLRVYKDTTANKLWELSGDQGNSWQRAEVDVPAGAPYKIIFEAVRGTGYRGDTAIDDVVVTTGKCTGTS